MNYRPEIDGLRAVAVLPVFLYHAGVPGFGGGFIGVDVFFVISGYLITSLIVSDMETGNFSVAGFYERRARRILPALFIVLAACIIATWFVLLPIDLKHFSESVVATALFVSNFYFKNRTGYFFVDEADTSPLLHTWSLAIEEQFYILFPLLLIAAYRYFPRRVRPALAAAGALSLVVSIWWVKHDQEDVFYLLPFRAWELLLGAILVKQSFIHPAKKYVNELAGFAGMGLILLCVLFYNRHIEFPGLSAVLPCLGTFLIISSNTHHRNFVGEILSLKSVVFVGLISYPFYLWHWPMIVLLKYQQDHALTWLQILLVFSLAMILSVLTWRYVENPIRHRKILAERNSVMKAAVTVFSLVVVLGLMTMSFDGFPQRMDPGIVKFASAKEDFDPDTDKCFLGNNLELIKKDQLCRFGNKTKRSIDFILWGDSHADAIYPAIKSLAEKSGMKGVFAGNVACPPLLGVNRTNAGSFCIKFNATVLDYITAKQIKNIILAARWDVNILGRTDYELQKGAEQIYMQDGDSREISLDENIRVFNRGITRVFQGLQGNGGNVWVVLQVPDVGLKTPYYLARRALLEKQPDEIRLNLAPIMGRHDRVRELFVNAKGNFDINLIDPADFLCTNDNCLIGYQGNSLYKDDDHLSRSGALLLRNIFMPIFAGTSGTLNYWPQ